jgi:hypothetical protein
MILIYSIGIHSGSEKRVAKSPVKNHKVVSSNILIEKSPSVGASFSVQSVKHALVVPFVHSHRSHVSPSAESVTLSPQYLVPTVHTVPE